MDKWSFLCKCGWLSESHFFLVLSTLLSTSFEIPSLWLPGLNRCFQFLKPESCPPSINILIPIVLIERAVIAIILLCLLLNPYIELQPCNRLGSDLGLRQGSTGGLSPEHSCASCPCSRQSASTFPSGLKRGKKERADRGVRRKNRMRGERSGMVSPVSALTSIWCSVCPPRCLLLVFILIYRCIMVPISPNQLPEIPTTLGHPQVIQKMSCLLSRAQITCKYQLLCQSDIHVYIPRDPITKTTIKSDMK